MYLHKKKRTKVLINTQHTSLFTSMLVANKPSATEANLVTFITDTDKAVVT